MDYKAFVSSTFVDLKAHRAYVIGALRKAGFFVDPMEEWTSSTQEPKEFSRNRLQGCHLCVLLLARRRGHVPEGETLSITQMEYLEARRRNIDVLPFVLDDEVGWPSEWDELATDPELCRWRLEVFEHRGVARFNSNPESVEIAPAATRWIKDEGPKVALRLYLDSVKQEHGVIRFVGLPILADNPDIQIRRLYVEPAAATQWISPDLGERDWPHTFDVLDDLSSHRKMVLLGDPGGGKSTLVSWISWQLAQFHYEGKSVWAERLGKLVPLPIVLRDLKIQPHVTWETVLESFVQTSIGRLLTLVNLRQILDDGQAMIMLDGLDEIADPLVRRDLRDALFSGLERYPGCRWLLTSRIVGYEEVPFHRARDESLYDDSRLHTEQFATAVELRYVAPFDRRRIERFSHNWFLFREAVEEKANTQSMEFLEAVHTDVATENLARVPNLLTMMALIYRVRARLPHGRALLYNEIVQAYLETIDFSRKIATRAEPLAHRKRWLARVAFEMQQQRAGHSRETLKTEALEIYASGDQVGRWVAAAMLEVGTGGNDEDAAAFVDYLAKRTGLLLPRGENRFAFLHLSFQEYFSASFLKEQITSPGWLGNDEQKVDVRASKKALKDYAGSPVWRESLVFLIELLASEQPNWLEPCRDSLFGPNFDDLDGARFTWIGHGFSVWWAKLRRQESRLKEKQRATQNQAMLLARLATNPHAGLNEQERQLANERCCYWAAVAESKRRRFEKNQLLRSLLAVGSTDSSRTLERFFEAAREIRLATLDLSDYKQVYDVSPLVRLLELEQLNLSRTSVSDINPLANLRKLNALSLSNTDVSDLNPLAEIESLKSLQISDTRVSDIAALKNLANLQQLSLSYLDLRVVDLTPLASLKGLRELHLDSTRISDLGALAALESLETLSFGGTNVSDLTPLAGLFKLRDLTFFVSKNVTDLSPVSKLLELEQLNFSHTQIADLSPLGALKKLESLSFEHTPVSDLTPLKGIQHLRYLYCSNTAISSLAALSCLPDLLHIHLSNTRVSDLMPLSGLTHLISLDISNSMVAEEHVNAFRDDWERANSRKLTIRMWDGVPPIGRDRCAA